MIAFWTPERARAFQEILKGAKAQLGIGYDGIAEAITIHVVRKDGSPELLSTRTIMRFMQEPEKTKPDNISTILMGVSEWVLAGSGRMLRKDIECCVPLIEMYGDLQKYKGEGGNVGDQTTRFLRENRSSTEAIDEVGDQADGRYRPLPIRPRSQADRRKDIVKFLAAFSRPSSASVSTEKKFFQNQDGDKIYFLTYRFSTSPGVLQRSFTVLHRPKDDTPIVRFSNFIGDSESPRRSGGIAINFENEVVFLGHTDNGGSIKVLSFSNARRPSDHYHGLLITNDPDDGSLASRFLMVRTEISDHADARTGPVSISDLKKELDKKWIDRLRNRVRFELEEPVVDVDNRSLTQKEMVTLVGRRLFDGKEPVLRDSRGFFNPADDVHYTFNSALKREG